MNRDVCGTGTHEVLVDVPDQLRELLAIRDDLVRRRRDEREPPLAVVYPQGSVEVKVQAVIEENNLKIVRGL